MACLVCLQLAQTGQPPTGAAVCMQLWLKGLAGWVRQLSPAHQQALEMLTEVDLLAGQSLTVWECDNSHVTSPLS